MDTASRAQMLAKPLGPFLDKDILKSSKEVMMPNKRFSLPLHSLVLCRNKTRIGLDNISDKEFRNVGKVQFRGLLCLREVNWLSDRGKKCLQLCLDERGAVATTVEQVVKDDDRFQILIQGVLFGNPKYLTDCKATEYSKASQNLFIESIGSTSEKTWVYSVESMAVYTYHHSRLYLSQYRALHAIQLIQRHNDSLPARERTLLQGRDLAWLIDQYLQQVKLLDERRHDTDAWYSGRHVHRAEAYHMFGKHARWLRVMVEKQKLLNIDAWNQFCKEAEGRNKAKKAGKTEEEIDEMFGAIPDAPAPVEGQEVFEEFDMEVDDVKADDVDMEDGDNYANGNLGIDMYSSDGDSPYFTDDEENLAVENSRAPIDAMLAEEVPQETLDRPVLPPSLVWFCHIDECEYFINFHDLTKENLQGMDEEEKKWLCQKRWKMTDERFTERFEDMVESHYFTHFSMKDIKVVAYGTDEVRRGHSVKKEREITQPGQLRIGDDMRYEWRKPSLHKILHS